MTTFYIYEVPGEKNGATKDWEARSQYNFDTYNIYPILIETMEGPDIPEFWQIVGDREWELADLNGYRRGEHYRDIRIKAAKHNWDNNARRIAKLNGSQSKAGSIGGATTYKLSKIEGTPANIARKNMVSLGGKALAKKERTCIYCGKTGKGVVMGRWHFDNCKHKKTLSN